MITGFLSRVGTSLGTPSVSFGMRPYYDQHLICHAWGEVGQAAAAHADIKLAGRGDGDIAAAGSADAFIASAGSADVLVCVAGCAAGSIARCTNG